MEPKTWQVTRDHRFAYVHVPKIKGINTDEIQLVTSPGFQPYGGIKYKLPDEANGVKALVLHYLPNENLYEKTLPLRLFVCDKDYILFTLDIEYPEYEKDSHQRQWF